MDMKSRFLFMLICQISATVFLANEMIVSDESYENYEEFPTDMPLVLTRFICGSVLHFYLLEEINQGFAMMKYSLNHDWKFSSW